LIKRAGPLIGVVSPNRRNLSSSPKVRLLNCPMRGLDQADVSPAAIHSRETPWTRFSYSATIRHGFAHKDLVVGRGLHGLLLPASENMCLPTGRTGVCFTPLTGNSGLLPWLDKFRRFGLRAPFQTEKLFRCRPWGIGRGRQLPDESHTIRRILQQPLSEHRFATRSMKPKVAAACAFVLATGRPALIGSLDHIEATLAKQAGTEVYIDLAAESALPHRHGVNQGEQ
jgi:hypothetical protein